MNHPRVIGTLALAVWVTVAAAVGLAGDAAATGGIAGTVTLSTGKPAAGVTVALVTGPNVKEGKIPDTLMPDDLSDARTPLAADAVVATAKADAAGKFEFKTIKAGSYRFRAGQPARTGMKLGTVAVEAGKVTTLDIKLNAPVSQQ